jgi:hypothetical protein
MTWHFGGSDAGRGFRWASGAAGWRPWGTGTKGVCAGGGGTTCQCSSVALLCCKLRRHKRRARRRRCRDGVHRQGKAPGASCARAAFRRGAVCASRMCVCARLAGRAPPPRPRAAHERLADAVRRHARLAPLLTLHCSRRAGPADAPSANLQPGAPAWSTSTTKCEARGSAHAARARTHSSCVRCCRGGGDDNSGSRGLACGFVDAAG